ncbi:hypothetical protein CHR55_30570 [Rhodococcus qingshengii]|uniref:Uncharacterized protein n=1 Tax=Rhodococcus qingshengii TaxID=334542 RepID=A0A2A5J1J0_RHOSG|nr:hypothetical protein CHR55_30570 [Rhodococcus qingshengii]
MITLHIETDIADRVDGSMTSDGRSDNSREPDEPSERAVRIEVVYEPDLGVIAEVTRADGRRFCGTDPANRWECETLASGTAHTACFPKRPARLRVRR